MCKLGERCTGVRLDETKNFKSVVLDLSATLRAEGETNSEGFLRCHFKLPSWKTPNRVESSAVKSPSSADELSDQIPVIPVSLVTDCESVHLFMNGILKSS